MLFFDSKKFGSTVTAGHGRIAVSPLLPFTPSPLHAVRGFTLIELVLVLLILSIAMGVVAPSLNNFLNGRKSTNATNQIVALARHARSQALSEGKVYRLNVDTTSNQFWIDAQDGANFSDVLTEHGQRYKLPDGLKASWAADANAPVFPVNTANAQAASNVGGALTGASSQSGTRPGSAGGLGGNSNGKGAISAFVSFYPDGRNDTAILTLDDGSGDKIQLGAWSETERWGVLKEDER